MTVNNGNTSSIPFLDLVTPHVELQAELTTVFQAALGSAAFIGGPTVEQFEREFAAFCETEYSIGASNGTDALRFALIAAGVKRGEVVITVANTFIATCEAISQVGAVPEFVDVDESTSNLDPKKLQQFLERECTRGAGDGRLISKRWGKPVSAVVPVHLYGQMAEMDEIIEIAKAHSLLVIEDACQAHGAEYFSKRENAWKRAGSMGHAAAFSFYPGKNLGACGEAGAVTTNSEAIARQVQMLRDHGQEKKYYHQIEGFNGRLDAIQAGLLSVKLRHLAKWNAQRRANAALYRDLLASLEEHVTTPKHLEHHRPVYHLFVIRTTDRQALQLRLADVGIGTGIHYPIPLHLQRAYRHLGYREHDFPVTERLACSILSLPMYPQLRENQIVQVVGQISNAVINGIATAQSVTA